MNLSAMAMALGSSLICRIAFGKRYDDGGSEIRRFEKLLHDAQAVLVAFYVWDYFPSLSWVDRVSGAVDDKDILEKICCIFLNYHYIPCRVLICVYSYVVCLNEKI